MSALDAVILNEIKKLGSKGGGGSGFPVGAVMPINSVEDLFTASDNSKYLKSGNMESDPSVYPEAPVSPYGDWGDQVIINASSDSAQYMGRDAYFDGAFWYFCKGAGTLQKVSESLVSISSFSGNYSENISKRDSYKMGVTGNPVTGDFWTISRTTNDDRTAVFRYSSPSNPVAVSISPALGGNLTLGGMSYSRGFLYAMIDRLGLIELDLAGKPTGRKGSYTYAFGMFTHPFTGNLWYSTHNNTLVEVSLETLEPTGRQQRMGTNGYGGLKDDGKLMWLKNTAPFEGYEYTQPMGVGILDAAFDQTTKLPIYMKVKDANN